MYWIKERHARIAHIKNDQPQRVRAAVIVTRHFHVWRHHLRLAGSYCNGFPPFQFQSERALQNVDSHREPVSFVALVVMFSSLFSPSYPSLERETVF
jgi:hypothetical protein